MQFTLKDTQLYLRNSTTRLPFRYGKACLTSCPQAILAATIETPHGVQTGYSGDCLPPGWFDKNPDRNYAQQINDMLSVAGQAQETFAQRSQVPQSLFELWLASYRDVHDWAVAHSMTPLLASFGVSLVERALLDAVARAAGLSFADAVHRNLYGLRAEAVHAELGGAQARDWLPSLPCRDVYVRHTVGLADPLTSADIATEDRLADGFPQSLEEYVTRTGIRYFKVKVANRLDEDVARLRTIARLLETHREADYGITLDGNEQYGAADEFDALVDAIESDSSLQTFWANTLWIEQPLERNIALDEQQTAGIRALGLRKAVIIDESDGDLDSFRIAARLGYRGVSSKNCKGAIRSLLNAGFIWHLNQQAGQHKYYMGGEDLCTVGVIPTQSDLCLTATLGLRHVERNGHHYHPGLSYLSQAEQQEALAAHGDFYRLQHGVVAPYLCAGKFEIASLQTVGFGFQVTPHLERMVPADQWQFASLGV